MNPSTPPTTTPAQSTHGATPQPYDGRVTVTPARPGKLVRLPVVEDRTGLGKSSIYAGVRAGTFPTPVRLSARAVAWRECDIDQWIAERTTARGQAQRFLANHGEAKFTDLHQAADGRQRRIASRIDAGEGTK